MNSPTDLMDAMEEELDSILIPVSEAQAQKIKALYPIYLLRRLQEMSEKGEMHAEFVRLWQLQSSPQHRTLQPPAPVEITRIVDAIVRERLRIVVAEDEQRLRIERERAALRQANGKARVARLVELLEGLAGKLNTWLFTIGYGCAMVAVGINVPHVAICDHRGDFCYVSRIREPKAAIDDPPAPDKINKQKSHQSHK